MKNAVVILLVNLLCWQVCFAQVDPWERVKLIEPGKKVSVKLLSGRTVNGRMEAWSGRAQRAAGEGQGATFGATHYRASRHGHRHVAGTQGFVCRLDHGRNHWWPYGRGLRLVVFVL